jgi:hypothetical protein
MKANILDAFNEIDGQSYTASEEIPLAYGANRQQKKAKKTKEEDTPTQT